MIKICNLKAGPHPAFTGHACMNPTHLTAMLGQTVDAVRDKVAADGLSLAPAN